MGCCKLSLCHLIFTLPLRLEVEPEILFLREKNAGNVGKVSKPYTKSVLLFCGITSQRKFAGFLRKHEYLL